MKMLYVVNTRHDTDAYRVYSKVHMDGKATKSAKITALVVGLLALSGGILAVVRQGPKLLYLATILFGAMALLGQYIGLWRMQRQLTKNAQNMDMTIDYRFGENAFDVTYPGQSESISYKDLQKIVETEGYYFLYTDIRMAHILPKKDFSQGSAAAFGKFISEKSGLELLQHSAK